MVDIDEAQAHLLRLIDGAAGGEPFVIARAGTPLVKVIAMDNAARTNGRFGFMAGQISIPEDFDRIGREEIERLFGLEPCVRGHTLAAAALRSRWYGGHRPEEEPTMPSLTRTVLIGALLIAGGAGAALAHHGWAWTLEEDFVLEGKIEEVYLGNPHAALKVMADGKVWSIELAPPSRTAAAGFVEGVAKAGDAVTAYGHRSKDMDEYRMKAERVRINGVNYDVYPNDLPS